MSYGAHIVLLALLSVGWRGHSQARTLSVFNPTQFVAALRDETILQMLVEAPLLALTEDVFQGVSTPIRLNRTVSVVGSPALPEPPLILLFAYQKIMLEPGSTFALVNVAIQYFVTDSPARAPNFYMFAPSKAPTLGPNSTRILMQGSMLILAVGLPFELRKQNVLSAKRPVWEPPDQQDIEWMLPDPPGKPCVNDSAAPLLDRCWFPGRDLYKDVAFAGGDVSATDSTVVPNNVTIHFINSTLVCQQLLSEECITSLGPYGCLVYTYRQLRGSPPVPISAQMAAILAQQQQQQPSVPPGFQTPSPGPAGLLDNGSSDAGGGSTAVLVGAIVGGVLGAAALVGVTRGSAETTCLGHEASGLQAHPSDFSGRQLNDLVVRAAPYREGLLTTNVTLVPSSSSAARAAGEACEEQNVQVEVVELLPIKLGRGSFGRVQEGRYRGQRVAVKQALDQHDGLSMPTGKLVASFLQEVEVMGRCDHPNICKLLAACLAPPKLCLVMELMDTSLESLIKGQMPGQLLPLPKLLHIAIQVAQGLEYLHPTVLHRDLKPANVLISDPESDTPIVKLADFGLSKIAEMTLQTANPEAGTPAYMAPECFDVNNFKLTHKMDIYAFGVLLWVMLTGEEPWKDVTLVSVAYSVHCGLRLPISHIPESRCSRKLRKLIAQCWEPTPRRRPAAAEVVKELLLVREHV
eukprot:XP_001697435.1 predicted protein [Chlamydomonas reinhardtii]